MATIEETVRRTVDLFDKCRRFTAAREMMDRGLYPYFQPIEESHDTEVVIRGETKIMVGSNNYLGLTHHPYVLEKARDALARYNLDIRTVAELVRNKVQGFEATKYNRKDRKIPVRVRLKDIETADIEELRGLVVNPGQTRPVPLSAVAELTLGRGPNEIRRIGQQRVGLVTANLEGAGLGSVGAKIDERLAELALPAGVALAVTGQSAEWDTSSRSLYLALGLSIFLVYVIMASQFESLVYPLIILVTIPLAFIVLVLVSLATKSRTDRGFEMSARQ